MVPAKETAEEQLLRMIEGPGQPSSSRGAAPPLSMGRLKEPFRRFADPLWRWFFRSQHRLEQSDPLLWRLRLAQRIFWVVLGGVGCYLVIEFVVLQRRPPTMTSQSSTPKAIEPSGTEGMAIDETLKPQVEYREALVGRNPFGLTIGSSATTAEPQHTKGRLSELAGALTIVGINRGRVPEALIEDAEAKRTFVVKVGDVVNQLTVKAIDEHGVIVSHEGEETTLK